MSNQIKRRSESIRRLSPNMERKRRFCVQREEKMTVDHDLLFKELLRNFFREFTELFYPELHEMIDYTHLVFLSEEVMTDITGGSKGRVDLLAEVKLKGEDTLIIVHIEPQ